MDTKDKKLEQLGMNPSTASNRLVKDILFKLLQDTNQDTCFRCHEKIQRENLSIEHKVDWLDSKDPKGLFFDLNNITFSHLNCNVSAHRVNKLPCGTLAAYNRGCRCQECKEARTIDAKERYNSELRHKKYKRSGH
jgi:hypothetical protein